MQKSRKLRNSFVEHPGAIWFLRLSGHGVFQRPRLFTTLHQVLAHSVLRHCQSRHIAIQRMQAGSHPKGHPALAQTARAEARRRPALKKHRICLHLGWNRFEVTHGADGRGGDFRSFRSWSDCPPDLQEHPHYDEDDRLFLDDTSSHMHDEQTQLLAKVNRLTIPVRVFSIGSGVFLLLLLAMLIYQKLNEAQ